MKKMALLLAALLLLSSLAGCGKSSKGEASVESVSMICGLNGVGQVDRFAGVVSAQGETKIAKDENRQVTSVAVKAGDEVKRARPSLPTTRRRRSWIWRKPSWSWTR